MPRPTAAQLVYGSATVVFGTAALLLLTQARSGLGVALASVIGLVLGIVVAIRAPASRPADRSVRPAAPHRSLTHGVSARLSGSEPLAARRRVREHSLSR
ncbi:hypothetical protein [Streptomyces sp. TP-A0874]|uniref:hypothetical protein n=1 Tax=Streptomyces sp. TP-A0874 TaxID=549819 RepID=UPI0008531AC4|nr:hypothetical protein [Streptomyces sp. TP-A0874]